MLTLAPWYVTLCDGNHSVSTASQHSELPGHKREHNAPQLDKAQCGFCCYSETRPVLSPIHICKIINRCLKSLLRPAYHKHTLSTTLYCSIFSISTSGSVPLHFLNPFSAAHTLMQSDHKHMQTLTQKNIKLLARSHMLTSVLRLIPFHQSQDDQKRAPLSGH